MKYSISFLLSLMLVSPLIARDMDGESPVITQAPNMQLRVHRSSNIAFSITNYGKIGSDGRHIDDPETGQPAPSAELPKDSGLEYLFQGCIWVGAIVENPDMPDEMDTLVSIAAGGWWYDLAEMMPPSIEYESIWRENSVSDEEYYAVYYDTVTNVQWVPPDPNDNRPHIPLGLKITQHSMCWSSSGYDEFFIVSYYIENIYDQTLNDVWLGIYYDGDVFHISENPYGPEEGAQDDLCGFIEHSENGIAWIGDNDGQPYDFQYDSISCTGVMGFVLLGSSTPGLQTNFNWWISNVDSQYDWGPQLQSNYDGPFPGGGNGTPGGDVAKYKVMSNGEHDYDQAFSALDWTDEGWIPNQSYNPENLANGFDTRFLISFGSLQLDAGEVETVTVAYIGGNGLHTDPYNYYLNLQSDTDDSVSIAEYYNNLDFSDLVTKADSVLIYYQDGYDMIPLGPPENFRVEEWDANFITLRWNHRDHALLQEYRIYRGTEPGVYNPESSN